MANLQKRHQGFGCKMVNNLKLGFLFFRLKVFFRFFRKYTSAPVTVRVPLSLTPVQLMLTRTQVYLSSEELEADKYLDSQQKNLYQVLRTARMIMFLHLLKKQKVTVQHKMQNSTKVRRERCRKQLQLTLRKIYNHAREGV